MADDVLCVWRGAHESVGTLARGGDDRLSFRYDASWLERGRPAISISLPLQPEPHPHAVAASFFANLLPDGEARQRVCAKLGISVDNDFALLAAIGGECAGALSLLPPGQSPLAGSGEYERIDRQILERLSVPEALVPLLIGGARTRLSLAGAHDKLPVLLDAGELYLPLLNAPSTHILKLGHHALKHVPENEALTTWFAEALGLEVAEVELWPTSRCSLLLVARYDRLRDDRGAVRRLHQEDLCQALGLPPSRKYESEGGPSFSRCVNVVRDHAREPLAAVRRLLRWTLFNLVAGNSDAHGKNLSLLYDRPGPPSLAPFYDLVCTRVYPRLDRHLAMRIGGEADPGQVARKHLGAMAAELGIGRRVLHALADEILDDGHAALDRASERLRSKHGAHAVIDLVVPVIRKQLRRSASLLRG